MVDEDTYVQQGRDLERAYSLQVINYILGNAPARTPTSRWSAIRSPTRSRTSSWGSSAKTDADGAPNPCYDVTPKFSDTTCTGLRNGQPRRDPRGLHPQRLRGRRREARHRARADGRQPDDVRGLRPRLRAAVVRRQRERRAEPGDGRRRLAARERRRHVELQRRRRRAGGCRRRRRSRPTTSRRPAGPAGRSRSTSTRTGSRTPRSRPPRASRRTRRSARRSATRSRT